ncbi:MAG: GlsB/YeaQ/YmgE family stress response membrane protein [Proteobacteria bacterium]|nr:GlsB/YeaQ/YmgE family stress response membrane protein [Pseudomonadota bacterium]
MMNFLGIVLTGLIVGLLARAIKPGDDRLGWLMTMLLGVAGSLVATYVGVAMNWYEQGETAGWIGSVVGAIALLVLYDLLQRKS